MSNALSPIQPQEFGNRQSTWNSLLQLQDALPRPPDRGARIRAKKRPHFAKLALTKAPITTPATNRPKHQRRWVRAMMRLRQYFSMDRRGREGRRQRVLPQSAAYQCCRHHRRRRGARHLYRRVEEDNSQGRFGRQGRLRAGRQANAAAGATSPSSPPFLPPCLSRARTAAIIITGVFAVS